jgi:hypothetical protein
MIGFYHHKVNLHPIIIFSLLVILLLWVLPAQSKRTNIQPTIAKLECGQQQQFLINTNVEWCVNGIKGGTKVLGTINDNGLYTAPSKVPVPAEVHICAKVSKAANSTLWATVLFKEKKPSYKILTQWSEKFDQPNFFREPHSICLEEDGNILLADMIAARVFRFSKDGQLVAEIGKGPGSEKGFFDKPRDVVVDSLGNIFVSDQKEGKPRIQVYDNKGSFLRNFAEEGPGPGEINRPHGLAVAGHKLIAIAVENRRANVYEHSGRFVNALGLQGPHVGKLITPHGIGVDPNFDIFISDYFGTVQKFSLDGEYILSFVNNNHSKGSAFIHTMCCDLWGNVYLMVRGIKGFEGTFEESKDRTYYIVKYNNHGDFICSIQLPEKDHQNIHAAVDSQGKIFVIFQGLKEMGVKVLGPE